MKIIRSSLRFGAVLAVFAIALPAASQSHAAATTPSPMRIQGSTAGTTTLTNTPVGAAGQTSLASEIPPVGEQDGQGYTIQTNRTLGAVKGNGHAVNASAKAKSNPQQIASFEGLNDYMSRYANNGNQYTLEPPDQAICAGNGYVVEGVNDAIGVYQQSGTGGNLLAYTSLNQFYNFAPAIVRGSPNVYGPEITDPTCYFDASTQRFYFSVVTLELNSAGQWFGGNQLDLAVSKTADPTGSWDLYSLEVSGNAPPGGDCPCLADYPHIGADSNGVYITVDDFPLAGPGLDGGYNEADIYAFSKQDLLNGTGINGWLFYTSGMVTGDPGYAVMPSQAPDGKYEHAAKGTEYFLSSTYDACSTCAGSDNRIAVWALTDTSNVGTTTAPTLSDTLVQIEPYTDPPLGRQESGDTPTGVYYYGTAPGEVGPIQTNDAADHDAVFANGKLWGALDTNVVVNGTNEDGVAYYAINPNVSASGKVSAHLAIQGTLALPNTDLVFPSVAVTQSGRGVLNFTLTGPNNYPSAAYSSLDAKVGAGPVVVAGVGQDAQDGFTEYSSRPRWGDYTAATTDGSTIWMGAEYIANSCSYSTYTSDSTCGHTRSAIANWSTRVTAVNMHP